MADSSKSKWSVLDGIWSHNPVFCAGMSAAPAVILGGDLKSSVTYAVLFTAVTLTTLLISSLLPRRIPYALRIIVYTVTAAIVYIPCYCAVAKYGSADPAALGVFLPLIVTGDFVVRASELRFFRLSGLRSVADIISHIIGFDAALIFLGAFRELFSQGGLGGQLYGINSLIPTLSAPFGGFILIGLIGAFIRACGKK